MTQTPKEKAEELYNKMLDEITGLEGHEWWDSAKKCAIKAVDEILKVTHSDKRANSPMDKEYWQQVKQELEKL